MSEAEPAPPLSMEMELLDSPGLTWPHPPLPVFYEDRLSPLFWPWRMTCSISCFPGLSFHLPVFSLQPPVLLVPDFIIFAISNSFFLVPVGA